MSCHDSNTSKQEENEENEEIRKKCKIPYYILGPVVQGLRHNAFTIITRVRLPSGLYSCFIFDASQEKMNKKQSIVCYNTCGLM